MTLSVDRIGVQRGQQPIGMLVDSRILRPESDGSDVGLPPLVLNPAFQRSAVWSLAQKQAWIESIMRGLGLPSIILNRFPSGEHPKYGWSEIVIDGQQRLRATAEFMQDKFKVCGETYGEQSLPFKRNWIMSAGIVEVIYCGYETERECAELYLKLLTAGTAHTPAEIKKAQDFIKECDK